MEDRIDLKKQAIAEILQTIVVDKNKNKKASIKFRKRCNFMKSFTHFCNAVAVSSLITSVSTINPFALIVGSVFASCSAVGSAVNDSMDNQNKYLTTRTTYNQLSNLERETRSVLLKNHLTSEQLDDLLENLNHQISLIQDSSLF